MYPYTHFGSAQCENVPYIYYHQIENKMKGYVYILECSNGLYYVGSTTEMGKRFSEHLEGIGANFTRKHFPVKLVYIEEFARVEDAFHREKQLQGWSRKKKQALIFNQPQLLHSFSECMNETHFRNKNKANPSTSSNTKIEDSNC